mgnify:CR=1 FL=1
MALRLSARGIQKIKEKTRGIAIAMKEEINWKKEILKSGQFNGKFETNLLENGPNNFMQEVYLGYMYSRFRKISGLNKDDSKENTGKIQS